MKKMLALGLMTVCLCFSFHAIAQTQATINQSYEITLDENQPLDNTYEVDLSQIDINDQAEFEQFCQTLSDMSFKVTCDFTAEKLTLELESVSVGGANWGVADWNAHLLNKVNRTKMVLGIP